MQPPLPEWVIPPLTDGSLLRSAATKLLNHLQNAYPTCEGSRNGPWLCNRINDYTCARYETGLTFEERKVFRTTLDCTFKGYYGPDYVEHEDEEEEPLTNLALESLIKLKTGYECLHCVVDDADPQYEEAANLRTTWLNQLLESLNGQSS